MVYEHVYIHVPHSSPVIPEEVWPTFTAPREEVLKNRDLLTDWHTDLLVEGALQNHDLWWRGNVTTVAANVNRLVVDVERFPDESEIMAASGMGPVYTRGHDGVPIRDEATDHSWLMDTYYWPHVDKWREVIRETGGDEIVKNGGKVLIIDVHSFPDERLEYEVGGDERPDLCIGVDEFHTPPELVKMVERVADEVRYDHVINSPFAGSYVPNEWFGTQSNVHSVMLEVRRGLYMFEDEFRTLYQPPFDNTSELIAAVIKLALGEEAELGGGTVVPDVLRQAPKE